MNSRQRFRETMDFGTPDRVPLFPEGIREGVLEVWQAQGLPADADLGVMFNYEEFEEFEPALEPRPALFNWQVKKGGLKELRRRLDPADPRRLPSRWQEKVQRWKQRQHALFLEIHQGFFLTMGVEGWQGFTEALRLLKDDPQRVHEIMAIQAEFAAKLAEWILREVEVCGVIFSEPIAGNHGLLISPQMYADFVLKSYEPILDVLESHNVKTIILRTYANTRALLPVVVASRINCLWACECNPESMDYRQLRAEFGLRLRLIGGIDTDILRQSQAAIRSEIEEKVLPLLSEGGYVPLADGRVREDIPFENYAFYRKSLEEITHQSSVLILRRRRLSEPSSPRDSAP